MRPSKNESVICEIGGSGLVSRRFVVRRRCVQTQSRPHALLPRAAVCINFFDLRDDITEFLTAELSHLEIQQRRHYRDKRYDEDIDERQKLLGNLDGHVVLWSILNDAEPNSPDDQADNRWNQHLKESNDNDRSPRS